ncbi:MAG TPA: hypothetical protein VKT00_02030 [Casimicrobiaceae bacterium]|nr:hypothetical protein [Casimicrobiaceae bacterium]
MNLRRVILGIGIAAILGGCAIKGTPILEPGQVFVPDVGPPVPTSPPLVESPPFEPVAPPAARRSASAPSKAAPVEPAAEPAVAPARGEAAGATSTPAATPAAVAGSERAAVAGESAVFGVQNGPAAPNGQGTAAAPPEPTEDQQLLRLLADLQRYGTLQADELKREIAQANAALTREPSDVNRLRLAVLYTMLRSSPQDDQRALQLLETVSRAPTAAPAVRYLAAVLQAQVIERQRAVKTEQQKGDAAIQKLEALRAMEQSLFRDRVRSGGDGGGGGGGAGGSGR